MGVLLGRKMLANLAPICGARRIALGLLLGEKPAIGHESPYHVMRLTLRLLELSPDRLR